MDFNWRSQGTCLIWKRTNTFQRGEATKKNNTESLIVYIDFDTQSMLNVYNHQPQKALYPNNKECHTLVRVLRSIW